MAINQALWTRDFAANLYDVKDFYRFAKNWSAYINGGIVHIPQAGTGISPVAITSETSLPISVNEVTYSDLTFTNKMVVAPPRYVTNIDASEASFDTRSEAMKEMVDYLRQAISIEIMNGWATVATSSVIRTSGTDTRTNVYGQATIKAMTFQDILDARAKLARQKADMGNLYLIVDPIMYNDLVQIDEFTKADELVIQTAVNGFVGMVGGFKVIQRALGLPFSEDSTGLAKPDTLLYTDAYADTYFSGALAVDGSKVGYALGTVENGEIKVGFKPYATGYYNDVLQAHTRIGASPLYVEASNVVKGVVSIVETD
jgi:hypothetical protein